MSTQYRLVMAAVLGRNMLCIYINECQCILLRSNDSDRYRNRRLHKYNRKTREEHRLRVSENRVLRGIFGANGDGVRGEWRKLHNEELNDLYCSLNFVRVIKSRRMRWAGHVARMEEGRGVHKVLAGET